MPSVLGLWQLEHSSSGWLLSGAERTGTLCPLSWLLVLEIGSDKCQPQQCRSSSYRGGFAGPLEQPCTSSVTLTPNEKGDDRAIFIFSWELEKGRRALHCVILKNNNRKSDPVEILSRLLFVVLLLSPRVFD